MHLLFLTNHDVPSIYALKLILPDLSKHHSIWLWQSSQVGSEKQSISPTELQVLKQFEHDCLVNDLHLKTEGNTNRIVPKIDTEFVNQYLQQPLQIENNINDITAIETIKSLNIDLVISIRYGKILKQPVIDVPRYGIINLHSGLLPEYRGVMATFWSMLNQESMIGTTLHYINDASIDTGSIIKRSAQSIDPECCYLANVISLYQQGCLDISDFIKVLEQNGTVDTLVPQGTGHYYSFPNEADIQRFKALSRQLVNEDWFECFALSFKENEG